MPSSEKTLLEQELRRVLRVEDRFADCAFRLCVYKRGLNGPTPLTDAETDPYLRSVYQHSRAKVYGGRYDRLTKRYALNEDGTRVVPGVVHEIKCTIGAYDFCTLSAPGVKRVIAIGAMGAGKSEAGIIRALVEAFERPNTVGGLLAPIWTQCENILTKFFAVAEPLGLVEDYLAKAKQIVLANGSKIDVSATSKSRKDRGYPFQGRDWDWAVADESSSMDDGAHNEITARGRANASRYVVYECTTYDDYAHFVLRLERAKLKPAENLILKFWVEQNAFADPAHVENLKALPANEYARKVLLLDVPPERLVYSRFALGRHTRVRPDDQRDITHDQVHRVFGGLTGDRKIAYVLGQDFGDLVNATVVLKAYRGDRPGDVWWWVVDEITTINEQADKHARLLRSRGYNPDECLVVADPHLNSKDSDKSDYNLFRNEGFLIVRAHPDKISVKGRINMVNALLENATLSRIRCVSNCLPNCIGHGEARLFLDCNGQGRPNAERLAKAFISFQKREDGAPQPVRKNLSTDHTHWPDALGYGLYPFEKVLADPRPAAPLYDMNDALVKKLAARSKR